MECKVKVIRGPDQGAEFTLHPGENIIGRGAKAAVRLTAANLSLEHAAITQSGDELSVENLSAHGTFLNDEKITGRTRIRGRDQLRLSAETVLRVEAADGSDSGVLGNKKLMWGAVGALVLALLLVLALSGGDAGSGRKNWYGAFLALDGWLDRQPRGVLTEKVQPLLREAWRLDVAGDYRHSRPVWLSLQLILDETAAKARAENPADPLTELTFTGKHPNALARLQDSQASKDPLPEAQYPAALGQFVSGRLQAGAGPAPKSRFPL